MKKSIFHNENFYEQLKENGYVEIPFLKEFEVEKLLSFFSSHHSHLPEGMYASSHHPDFNFRKEMNKMIKQTCERAIKDTFSNVRPLGATFMVKNSGANGSLHPHQDWNIVDETKFNSYNIWLPLVDVDTSNGTLLVLPKSHLLQNNIRGLHIHSVWEEVLQEVKKQLIPLNVKAGNAIVYDHRLLHASDINSTSKPRITVVYGIIPEEAPMYFYYGNNNEIEIYDCDEDFYFNFDINKGPTNLNLFKKVSNPNISITKQDIIHYSQKKSIFNTLIQWFK